MSTGARDLEPPRVFVVTSEQAAARDAAAIAAGIPSRALMQRAGTAIAVEVTAHHRGELATEVLIFTGPGNNGGDGWVVARALASVGMPVRVVEVMPAKSPDALAERALAVPFVETVDCARLGEIATRTTIIDAMLGTGSSGTPRGAIAEAVGRINDARARHAFVIAVDLPTGVDATTGASDRCVIADLTITFGTIKRGHLVARQACGAIAVVDIGLGEYVVAADGAPLLVTERWVSRRIPPIPADAHKGTRKKLAIVGGAEGMAGASILAARAAQRSGIGMVRLIVSPSSLPVVQGAEPFALAGVWPGEDTSLQREILSWADGLVIGPGLGNTAESRALIDRLLERWSGPVVLDADALNVFDGDLDALARAIGKRPALLTPHPAEFARLMGCDIQHVLNNRFEIGGELARRTGAAVLLKGVPTVITSPHGETLVSAAGTPALAAAGSGDILSGIAGALLTQLGGPLSAGAIGAWIHGRAAELAVPRRRREPVPLSPPPIRGTTLDDVLAAISLGFATKDSPARYPVLLRLPAVGERR